MQHRWGKEEYFHKTDTLLTLIEESATWRTAFGFDLGGLNNTTPTGKGKSLIQHCADIAITFFIDGEKGPEWKNEDIKLLRSLIKNCVNLLKSTYHAFKAKLGETRHGLVVSGSADELREDSEVANVWAIENIEKKFPWYCQMATLIGGNPNHSCSAVANSQSNLDLGVLGMVGDVDEDLIPWPASSPAMLYDEDDDILDRSLPPLDSLLNQHEKSKSKEKVMLTLSSKRSGNNTTTTPSTKKCKTTQDIVKEVADAERQARLSMNEVNAREKTIREEVKHRSQYEIAVRVETMRLKAQQDEIAARATESAAQHAHELMMVEKQIELAHIQHGGAGGNIDP
ncbi:hypothetical protein JVU11DRAFT_8123 [Chiua virens]|nr:hypothetical protein JVU11DRAFT_8123 [Chiua virens]